MWHSRVFRAARAALLVTIATVPVTLPARAGGVVPDTAWSARGLLICGRPNAQETPAMAATGAGGFFVAWEDSRAIADTSDLYVQQVLGDGHVAPGWPADGVALTLAPGNQNAPQIVGDGVGGVLAVWEDFRFGSTSRLYAQHLSSSGVPVAGWSASGLPVCIYASIQRAPKLVSDGAGGALIFWEDYRFNQPRIYAQHMNANGTLATGWADSARVVAPAPGGQVAPAAASDGAGGAYVTWSDGRGGATTSIDIYAQRLRGDGTPATGWPGSGLAVTAATGAQDRPSVAADGTGGAVFAWTDPSGGSYFIYAQRLTGAGAVATGWTANGIAVSVTGPGQFDPVLASDGLGAVLVAWVDARGGLSNADIYAQRLDPNGAPAWQLDGLLVCGAPGDQVSPRIAHDGSGGALVCWMDNRFASETRLYAQRISAAGAIASGWPANGLVVADTNLVLEPAAILPDGNGGAFCAWSGISLPAGSSGPDIFGSRITGNAVVPALASLLWARASLGEVALRWWTPGASEPFTVERATNQAGPAWVPVAVLSAGAGGVIDWQDRAVSQGVRYGYRLRGREGTAGEVWLAVPRAELALARVDPGPADAHATFAVTLARAGEARLEVFDVAGRRRLERTIAGDDSASNVTLDTSLLAPGSYRVRLRQGPDAVTARLRVIR